ncbi:centromere DNA-binding like protein [Nitzschia inconspicua]|uniref:Centromere DNA-binding like protein n=1 Tax=Nitzschia inconspicua TaxID=303405 RepID=A0A9K3M2N1_9STRA|nr:centromere DNA-binding like protein [Nitzschia inconspicua]
MTTFAILPGESMFKAELSDLYGGEVQMPDDPHPIYVMMMQIYTGKTNQDLKLFGRAAHHKSPLLCPVGALAFYSLYRFSQTEVDGDDNELIRILGNWDPKIQEKAYSSKLPMKIVRSRAGFRSNGGVHYNARTIVQPPSELLSQLFPWVDRATQELNTFLQSSPAEARPTAAVFLDFMMKLKVVVLQDAAATMVLHPMRSVHQLFQLDEFKGDCFKAYVEQLRQQLAVAEDPNDVTLQTVIPPVVDRLNVLCQQGERKRQASNEVSNQIRTGFDSVHVGHDLILQLIRSLALPINQILQLLKGTEKSTAIMIGLIAANDYIQRTQSPSHSLQPLNTADSPQRVIDNSNPLPQLPWPNEPSILPRGLGHKLSHSHNSVMDLYNEWYGLDQFKDVPVAGGIQAMDNRYKTAWRRSWSRAEQKIISSMKIVIDTMNKQIASGRTLLEVSKEFEEAFAKHCKKKISNLVES